MASSDPALVAHVPEGPHGIERAPTTMGRTARDGLDGFVRVRVASS